LLIKYTVSLSQKMRAELRFDIFIVLSNKERDFSTSMVTFRRKRSFAFRVILNMEAAGPSIHQSTRPLEDRNSNGGVILSNCYSRG